MRMPDEILNEFLSIETNPHKRFLIKELANSSGSFVASVKEEIKKGIDMYKYTDERTDEEIIKISDLEEILYESGNNPHIDNL